MGMINSRKIIDLESEKEFLNNLKVGVIDFQKYLIISKRIESQLAAAYNKKLISSTDLDILNFILKKVFIWNSNTRSLELTHETQKRAKLSLVNSKGLIATKMRIALLEMGVSLKATKKEKLLLLKSLYESLYKTKSSDKDGESFYYFFIAKSKHKITWQTDAQKKMAIITVLRKEFGYTSKDAMIEALRKLNTSSLPAKTNTGWRRYRE